MLRALSQPRGADRRRGDRARQGVRLAAERSRPHRPRRTFILKTYDPHVLLLHLIELDGAQHTYGPGSPEALQTLARIDAHVGEILDAVKASGRADRTHDRGGVGPRLPAAARRSCSRTPRSSRPGLLTVNERGRGDVVAGLLPLERRLGLRLREGPGRPAARAAAPGGR